nr:hypothetical protein [Tanacetum cinerariifolium]
MYPRFLQLFLNNQIALEEPFNDVYVTPAHTKKVFSNMKRKNKDFSKTVTLLFATILVPPVVEGEGSGQPYVPQPPSSNAPPKQDLVVVSQPQKTQTLRRTKRGQDTEIPQSSGPPKKVGDEAVYTWEDDKVVRAATTTASLEAEQESGSCLGIIQDCSRLGDQKVAKESQKIRKEAHGKNSKDVALQDCEETEVFDYITAAEKDVNVAEPASTAGDVVNAASVINDVSLASPSTSAASPSTMIHDVEEEPRRATPPPTIQSQDKGKGKMVEPKPISKNLIKAQIQKDAKIAQRLFEEEQAQFERGQRIAREKAAEQEAKDSALIEKIEDV